MKSILAAVLIAFPMGCFAITAQSYIVTDMQGNAIIEKNADEMRPIASITKLFVVEQSIKLDQDALIEITGDDVRAGRMRSSPLRVGQSYTRRDLTQLALVSSDNVAAIALGRTAPPATSLAHLVESSGLNPENQSTARNLAVAARELYSTDIGPISTTARSTLGERHSTNPLLDKAGWKFFLSKTGFINQAGGCLVVVIEVKEQTVAIVVLGAANTHQRWLDLIEIRKMLGDHDFYVPIKVTKVVRYKKHRKR